MRIDAGEDGIRRNALQMPYAVDIPEVLLVAILDPDKEGFLRSEHSLIQTIGRAARNLNGTAILYADRITDSMKKPSLRPDAAATRIEKEMMQAAQNLEFEKAAKLSDQLKALREKAFGRE